jgi:TatD DNase family protein
MLIDTHAHLDQTDFDDDRRDVLRRATESGVETMIAVGTTGASSIRCVELAEEFKELRAAVGIQPNYVHEAQPGDWDSIVKLAQRERVVALGETGLDRYWDFAPFALQQEYFDRHLRLSQQTGLPVVIHLRDSEADILEMLREARLRGPVSGVMHSYAGSSDGAAEAVELGLYVSFAGMVTYKKSNSLRECAASVPSDRILVETDSPYLSPEPVRKVKRNEPAHLCHTAARLAEVRGLSLHAFAAQTTVNAQRLFHLD